MKIFEFQFNPKAQKDRFFKVFTYTPAEDLETDGKDRGSLYMIGELDKALPKDATLLHSIAEVIQKEYYGEPNAIVTSSGRKKKQKSVAPEIALKNGLKRANDFLDTESKQGNIDWLGNLHFSVLAFVPNMGGANLYFTKIGNSTLWMARKGSLVDVGKNLESTKKTDQSAKVFGSVVSGKVLPNDRVFALTQDLFDTFVKEDLLQSIVGLEQEKQFQKLFKSKEKQLSSASGVLFYVLMEPEEDSPAPTSSPGPAEESEQKERKLPQLPKLSLKALPRPTLNQLPLPSIPSPWLLRVSTKKISFLARLSAQKKKLILLAILAIILLLGFLFFNADKSAPNNIQEDLDKVHTFQIQAESALIIKNEKRAGELLKEAWTIVSSHEEEEFNAPTKEIKEQLYILYKVEEIAELEILTQFDEASIPFLIGKENKIDQYELPDLPSGFQLSSLEGFGNSLYLVDQTTGNIIKSPNPATQSARYTPWLEESSLKKPVGVKSIAIDGSIWALMENGEIQRYYKGRYEESIEPDIFPALENALLLKANAQLPYLYILDAFEMRLVVLTKSGDVIKQYKNDAFAHVTDFAIGGDGTIVYLFAGTRVFVIKTAL